MSVILVNKRARVVLEFAAVLTIVVLVTLLSLWVSFGPSFDAWQNAFAMRV
jgi:hypothetical protein